METTCKQTHKHLSQVAETPGESCINVYLVLQICLLVGSLFHLYNVGVQKSENVLLSTTVAMVAIVDTRMIAW